MQVTGLPFGNLAKVGVAGSNPVVRSNKRAGQAPLLGGGLLFCLRSRPRGAAPAIDVEGNPFQPAIRNQHDRKPSWGLDQWGQ